jgi:hypothetical protein
MRESDEDRPALPSWPWAGIAAITIMGIFCGWLILKMVALVAAALMASQGPY